MINPPPRPALRKAPDADVHPVAATPAPPAAPSRQQVPDLRPVVGIGGLTSDTLLSPSGKGKKVKKTTLEVKVPKALLKSARQTAKSRGDALDDVLTLALRQYLDG